MSDERVKLKKIVGKREYFYGVFCGASVGHENMSLIKDVKHNGKIVADHINLNTDNLYKALSIGDNIVFKAKVHTYRDRNNNRKYGLYDASNIFLESEYNKVKEMNRNKKNMNRRRKR